MTCDMQHMTIIFLFYDSKTVKFRWFHNYLRQVGNVRFNLIINFSYIGRKSQNNCEIIFGNSRGHIFVSVVAILKPLRSKFGKITFEIKLDMLKIYIKKKMCQLIKLRELGLTAKFIYLPLDNFCDNIYLY